MRLKRIYDGPAPDDGPRVLVDRLWPRGVTKERAALHLWAKDLAPSNELRKAVHAGDVSWDDFPARYRMELEDADLSVIPLDATLVTSAKVPEESHVAVLRDILQGH